MSDTVKSAWLLLMRTADRLSIAANTAGTLTVLLLVLVVNYDVVARGFFGAPFMGAVEVVQFSLVFIVFLQLPDVIRVGRLTRSDGFLVVLGMGRPRLALLLQRAVDLLAAIFMFLVAYAMWPEFLKMWHSEDFFGVPGVFTAPWWPIKLVIFASGCLCTLIFIGKIVGATSKPAPDADSRTDTAD